MSGKRPPIEEARAHELLQRERERIERSLAERLRTRRDEAEGVAAESDPSDDSELIVEEEVDDAVIAQLRDELAAIERAEKRLAEGTYGFSVESGKPIPAQRLEAIPWAERTAEEQQRHRG